MNNGYSFYSGNFPFPWRPTLGVGVLQHVPRHFPLNILIPPPPPLAPDELATSTPSLPNLIKEDEVSSSATEDVAALKRRDTGMSSVCLSRFDQQSNDFWFNRIQPGMRINKPRFPAHHLSRYQPIRWHIWTRLIIWRGLQTISMKLPLVFFF